MERHRSDGDAVYQVFCENLIQSSMTVIQLLTAQPEKYYLDNIFLRQNPLSSVLHCSKTSHRVLLNSAPLLCNYIKYISIPIIYMSMT